MEQLLRGSRTNGLPILGVHNCLSHGQQRCCESDGRRRYGFERVFSNLLDNAGLFFARWRLCGKYWATPDWG